MTHPSAIEQAVYASPVCPAVTLRTTRRSTRPYALHFHESLSLGVVFDGETRLSLHGEQRILRKGDMVLLAPLETHGCNPLAGGFRSYHMFYVGMERVGPLVGCPARGSVSVVRRVIRDRRLFAAVMKLADAVAVGTACLREDAVLERIIRDHCVPAACEAGGGFAGIMNPAPAEPAAPLARAAKAMGIGREWLIRSFYREKGITPGGYRQCLRLAQATRMLAAGADIARTAAACGYADQSHLHRMCVKYLSATPRQLKPAGSLSYKK